MYVCSRVWEHLYTDGSACVYVYVCLCTWRPEAEMGSLPHHSPLYSVSLNWTQSSSVWASLASQPTRGFSLCSQLWNYSGASMPTWHVGGTWGSEFQSPCLPGQMLWPTGYLPSPYSKYFKCINLWNPPLLLWGGILFSVPFYRCFQQYPFVTLLLTAQGIFQRKCLEI